MRDRADDYELSNAVELPPEIDGSIPYLSAILRFAGDTSVVARLLVDLVAKANLLLTEPFIERAGLHAPQTSGASIRRWARASAARRGTRSSGCLRWSLRERSRFVSTPP